MLKLKDVFTSGIYVSITSRTVNSLLRSNDDKNNNEKLYVMKPRHANKLREH